MCTFTSGFPEKSDRKPCTAEIQPWRQVWVYRLGGEGGWPSGREQWQLWCHLLHKRRRRSGWCGRVRTSSDVAAVMKRGRNDCRQEVEGGGSGALCIIHPCWHIRISDSSEEGHQSSHNPSHGLHSSVGAASERHTMDTCNCKPLTRGLKT